MPRCSSAVAAVLLLPALLFGQASTPSYWRYAPADPVLLVGIDWRQATQSDVPGLGSGALGGFSASLDFAEEVTNVLIAAEPGAKGGKGRFLAIVSGKFNDTKLRGMAAAEGVRPKRYRGADLYSSSGTDVAVLEGKTLLAGDTASVRASLDRGTMAKPREGAIWKRAGELSAAYTLWVTLPDLEAIPGASSAGGPMLSGVKSLNGGIAFHRGMEMSFDVGTSSPETAGALAVLMQGAVASQAQAQAILRGLAVRADGPRVNLSASLDLAQLETGVKAMFSGAPQGRGGLMDWVMQGSQPAPKVAVTPKVTQPPPPQRKTIRIVGLEEGTREIPYPAGAR